jgi:hypothetical protein
MVHSSQGVFSRVTWRGQVLHWGDSAEHVNASQAQPYRTKCRDQGVARKWASRFSAEIGLSILAGVLLALAVAAAGAAMPRSTALADRDAPAVVRVIDPDGMEPFIVCTTRAQVTTCKDLDLSTGHH